MIYTWLIERFGKLGVDVLGILLVFGAVVGEQAFVYHAGWKSRDTEAQLAQQTARATTLTTLAQLGHQADAVAGDYVLRRGAAAVFIQTIHEEIPHVVTRYRTSLSAAPVLLPRCVFTRGFVRVWNDALDTGDDTAGLPAAAGSPAPAAADPDPADELDAGVSEQQVLENHVDTADALSAYRQWHDAVMAWDMAVHGPERK